MKIKVMKFICESHRDYLDKCGQNLDECGAEYCFAWLYTQGVIDDETMESVESLNEDEFEKCVERAGGFYNMVFEEFAPRRDEARFVGERADARRWHDLMTNDNFQDEDEVEILFLFSKRSDVGIFDRAFLRKAI